jgi:hypothetical protein
MAKYKEKRILLFDLRISTAIQICLKYVKVPKSLDPIGHSGHSICGIIEIVHLWFSRQITQ